MDRPHPSTDGRDLSTTPGFIVAHPPSPDRTLSTALGSAVHAPPSIHGPRGHYNAGSDGPGGASPFINLYPDSADDPGFSGAWSGLETGVGSSGIDGSGSLTFVHPLAGLNPGLGGSRFRKSIQLKPRSGSMSVHGLLFGFNWGACGSTTSGPYNNSKSSGSDRVASEDVVGEGLDGSINGLGLAVDDAGFGAGACTTFVDPCLVPSGAELDDACAPDNAGFGTGACTSVSSYNHS